MFEPTLLALTSTPSIAASSAELTSPVSATAGACGSPGAMHGNATASARARASFEATLARRGWCMVLPRRFSDCPQHRLRGGQAPSLQSHALVSDSIPSALPACHVRCLL